MDGLFIRSINYKRIMAHPKALAFYRALPPAIFSPVAPAAASALDVLNRTAQQGEEKKAAPAPVPFPPPAFANAQAAMWTPAAATNLHAPTIAASQASVPQSQPVAVLAASQRPAAAVPASQGVVRHNLEISSFSRSQPPAFGAPGGSKVKPLPTPQRAASLSAQVLTLPPPPPPPPMPALLPQIAALPPPPPRVTLLPDLSAVKSEPLIQGSTPPLPSAGDVIVIDDSPARPASDGLTEGEARAPIKEIDLDDLSEMEQEVVNARSNSERLSGGEDGKDRKRKLADNGTHAHAHSHSFDIDVCDCRALALGAPRLAAARRLCRRRAGYSLCLLRSPRLGAASGGGGTASVPPYADVPPGGERGEDTRHARESAGGRAAASDGKAAAEGAGHGRVGRAV